MKKKVIFSTDTLSRGGKERQMMTLASQLLKKDYEVKLIAKRNNEKNNYLKEYNISEAHVNIFKGFSDYRKTIMILKPDIVISWDIVSSLYNLVLYRIYGYEFINGSIRHGIRLFRFSHLLRTLICVLSPYVIANSLAGLKANNLKPGKKRFVLHNGIENKFLNNLSIQEIEELKQKIIPGYKESPGFVYVSVANLVPYKDYFTVFLALKDLVKHFNFYYLIIGDGPLRKEIEERIKMYDLKSNVILVGRIENVQDYLKISDCMIHSSRGEGISNAILEGMYAGLPVIATNVGGIPETVFPESSMLFNFKDHEALYQCLLKSHELKASFNPESDEYKAHLQKFSVDNMVARFEEIMEVIMKRKLTVKARRR